jgi:hypothetical protein
MEKFRPITEDAFGRQRVCEPHTLFDAHHRYKLSDKFYAVKVNGGDVTHLMNESTALLTITTATGSSVVYESTTVQPYQPGKSLFIMLSFAMGSATNTTYKAGYFSTLNGIYFQVANGIASIVKRNNGQETSVSQSDWNMNKLKGVLDVSKTQIFWIDIEWLGVGRVRCGFNIGGVQIPCHSFFHANIEEGVYMTTATLPLRYELFSTGTITGSRSMKQICATVMSEGGTQIKTNIFSQDNKATLTVANTQYAVLSIRLKSSTLDAFVLLSEIDILLPTSGGNVRWRLYKNIQTVNGGLTWINHATSQFVEVSKSIGTITTLGNAQLVTEGFAFERESFKFVSDYNQQLTRTTTADVYTLVLQNDAANKEVSVLMKWNEL